VSVWNRIGDIASNTAKGTFNFAGDVIGSVGGVAKFAWDVGTAPWNDAEEYNGFVQPFKTAAAKEGENIVKPLATAGGAIAKVPGLAPALETLYKVNQEAIREPASTYFLMQGQVSGGKASFFNPDDWKRAYKGAQTIDFGKALGSGAVAATRMSYDPQFNIYDPREREAAYKSGMFSALEKTGNIAIQIFGDVSLGAAKGLQVAKASTLGVGKLSNADAVAKAAEDITRAQYGVDNRFTKVLKDFTDNGSTYAISHPMVKSSSNPGLLAHLLGDSVDVDETALILRSALGDPKAMNDLRLQRTYITDALETERGKLSAVDEFKLFSAPDGSGMLPFLNDNKAVTDEALANYRSLAATDKYFADLMEVGKAGGSLTRTTGKVLQGAEDFVAKSRSLKFYDQTVGVPKVEIFQPTPFHRLYQKVSWAAGERPSGLVDFNDPDSYREVIANVSRLEKRLNLTPEQSKALLDPYLAASTPEAKYTATLNLEGTGLRALAKKYNVDEEVATELYNNYKGARTSALKSIKDKGFMVDTDNSIIKVPQLESQTANFLPIMDFDLMDDMLKRNARQINLLGNTKNAVFNSLDFVQDMFKAAVLLRLGYTIRNTVDSSLRIAASVGAYAQLRHLGPGLKSVIYDTVATPARLVDKYRAVDAGLTFSQVQKLNTKVINELNELKTSISALEAKVSLNPDDIDLAGELNTFKLLQEEKQSIYQHYANVLNKSKGAKIQPLYPNVRNYTDGGTGGLPGTRSVVGFVDTKYISKMPGNTTDVERVSFYREKLRSGKGFDEPVMVVYDNESGLAYVGEGNHRIQAAILEKIPYIPVRVVRGTKSEMTSFTKEGRSPKQIKNNKTLPFTTGGPKGPVEYMPTDVHPSFVFDKEYITDKDLYAQGGKNLKPNQTIGSGSYDVTTSDGQKYILDDAFGGPLGDMFKRIASSGNSFERMVDSNTDLYKTKLSSKGIGAVKPSDPGYFDQWAQTLRTQFGNSAVVKKIIKGESLEDIARWLRGTPEGRDLRRRLAISSDKSTEYVNKVNGFLDQYLPVSSNLRNKLSDITANDLRSTFKDPTVLPIIHGHVLTENIFNASDISIKKGINSLFKLLATMPEDAFARNPVYVHLYRQEAKRRIEVVAGLRGEIISKADQEAIMSQSHKFALREMKGILFNIERKTNLATAMKYINPFFSAQENAYKTWTKLAVADPSIVNKGYLVWQSPNRAGLVTDEDGNQVPVGQTKGNDTIWLDVPKGLRGIPGLESLTTVGIPKGSLDIVFQGGLDVLYNTGNPNIISDIFPVGPYVGVTVGELTKNQPDVRESIKGMFPYGYPKDALSAFLPPWLQRELTRKDQLKDPQFARTYQLIWKTEQQNAKRDGKPPVSPAKIMDMTKDYWRMRTFANLIMPFAPRFDSPYKFYLDKSKEYKRIYGVDADTKFLNDYPDYFDFSASLSKNPTGVQNSVQATENIKKYGGLVSELSKIDPKLIGLVVNNPSGYEFSQSAYNYLYNKKVSPDSPDTFLSSQSPAESQKKNDAEKGWIKYNKMSDAVDEELQKRGLSSVQETGAEDLKYIKEQVISKLAVQTDADGKPLFDKNTGQYVQTAWYDDYLDSDGSKTNKVIVGLGTILNNPDFIKDNGNNTTWKSISTYLNLRNKIATELAKRDVKSIDAKANKDMRYIYDAVVNKLKSDDKLGFSYVYDRFLSQDLVFDKYLTPKVVK
jgi:hypothetical protein